MLRRIYATSLVLALTLGQLPVRAAGVSPVGVVTQALRASLSGVTVSAGATVYDSDSFTTASDGLLRVRAGAAQFYVAGQSAVRVHSVAGGTLARLTAGTLVFSSARLAAMDIEVEQAHIRPAADRLTVAQISIVGAKLIDVRATRGSLRFSYHGETQTIPEGVSCRFALDPSDNDVFSSAAVSAFPGRKTAGPGLHERKAFLYFIIGGMGVLTYVAVDEALESPSKP